MSLSEEEDEKLSAEYNRLMREVYEIYERSGKKHSQVEVIFGGGLLELGCGCNGKANICDRHRRIREIILTLGDSFNAACRFDDDFQLALAELNPKAREPNYDSWADTGSTTPGGLSYSDIQFIESYGRSKWGQ